MTTLSTAPRRVVLLETDERSGLVAALADTCAAQGVSLEITTGPGHVLITFSVEDNALTSVTDALKSVPGVISVQPYTVAVPA
jgi:hypothetical protein